MLDSNHISCKQCGGEGFIYISMPDREKCLCIHCNGSGYEPNSFYGDPSYAFPTQIESKKYGVLLDQRGMTLRDYFAAAALMGLRANAKVYMTPEEASIASYEDADAMLKEREKEE